MTTIKHFAFTAAAITTFSFEASAITIVIDYSHDTNGYFSGNAAATAALEAAAADISNAITTQLDPLSRSDLTFNGTSGSSNTSFTANLNYTNPQTGASESYNSPSLGADEFRIFVGARPLSGSTLGQGGPGGVGFTGGGGSGNSSTWAAAIADAENNFNNSMERGGSIIVSSFSGSSTLGPTTANYTLNFAPTIGNLWFDTSGTVWNFDHTNLPGSGENDFYSVALHEMLHTLGVGSSTAWDSFITGTDWLGPEVIALLGSGTDLINPAGDHIAASTMSPRISDGVMQEVVMDPNITTGTRKELTQLDLAFLRDLGWQTIPEPSSITLLGLGSLAFILRRRK